MKLDSMALDVPAGEAGADARRAEADGYDGWFVTETANDPFILAALGACGTESVDVGTGVAVAFARSPMDVAYSANDLQQLTGGRFLLGIGSQVRAHIERRFSMPWSRPAARMREYVLALRSIWATWLEDEPLDFRGEFYEHRLMTPHFAGTKHAYGPPRVALAAVGPGMTRVAGEVADLVLCNPFTTRRYVDTVTLPSLAEGVTRADRSPGDIGLSVGVFVVTGRTDSERDDVSRAVRERLAFYASTPAYAGVLDCHGLGDLHEGLKGMAREQRWAEMAGLVDDDMLELFAVVIDDPDDVGGAIVERWGEVADRVWLYPTWTPDAAAERALQYHLRSTQIGG